MTGGKGRVVTVHRLRQRRDDLEIEGLADRARFLRAVEDGDGSHAGRKGSHDLLRGERLEEPDAEQADLLPGRDEGVDGLLDGTGG